MQSIPLTRDGEVDEDAVILALTGQSENHSWARSVIRGDSVDRQWITHVFDQYREKTVRRVSNLVRQDIAYERVINDVQNTVRELEKIRSAQARRVEQLGQAQQAALESALALIRQAVTDAQRIRPPNVSNTGPSSGVESGIWRMRDVVKDESMRSLLDDVFGVSTGLRALLARAEEELVAAQAKIRTFNAGGGTPASGPNRTVVSGRGRGSAWAQGSAAAVSSGTPPSTPIPTPRHDVALDTEGLPAGRAAGSPNTADLSGEMQALRQQVFDLTRRLNDTREEQRCEKREHAEVESKWAEEREKLQNECNDSQTRVAQLESRAAAFPEVERRAREAETQLAKLKTELSVLRDVHSRTSSIQNKMQAELDGKSHAAESAEAECARLEAELHKLMKDLDTERQASAAAEVAAASAAERLAAAEAELEEEKTAAQAKLRQEVRRGAVERETLVINYERNVERTRLQAAKEREALEEQIRQLEAQLAQLAGDGKRSSGGPSGRGGGPRGGGAGGAAGGSRSPGGGGGGSRGDGGGGGSRGGDGGSGGGGMGSRGGVRQASGSFGESDLDGGGKGHASESPALSVLKGELARAAERAQASSERCTTLYDALVAAVDSVEKVRTEVQTELCAAVVRAESAASGFTSAKEYWTDNLAAAVDDLRSKIETFDAERETAMGAFDGAGGLDGSVNSSAGGDGGMDSNMLKAKGSAATVVPSAVLKALREAVAVSGGPHQSMDPALADENPWSGSVSASHFVAPRQAMVRAGGAAGGGLLAVYSADSLLFDRAVAVAEEAYWLASREDAVAAREAAVAALERNAHAARTAVKAHASSASGRNSRRPESSGAGGLEGGGRVDTAAITAVMDALSALRAAVAESEASATDNAATAAAAALENAAATMCEREAAVTQREATVASREAAACDREAMLAEREDHLLELDERRKECDLLESALRNQAADMAVREAAVDEKEAALGAVGRVGAVLESAAARLSGKVAESLAEAASVEVSLGKAIAAALPTFPGSNPMTDWAGVSVLQSLFASGSTNAGDVNSGMSHPGQSPGIGSPSSFMVQPLTSAPTRGGGPGIHAATHLDAESVILSARAACETKQRLLVRREEALASREAGLAAREAAVAAAERALVDARTALPNNGTVDFSEDDAVGVAAAVAALAENLIRDADAARAQADAATLVAKAALAAAVAAGVPIESVGGGSLVPSSSSTSESGQNANLPQGALAADILCGRIGAAADCFSAAMSAGSISSAPVPVSPSQTEPSFSQGGVYTQTQAVEAAVSARAALSAAVVNRAEALALRAAMSQFGVRAANSITNSPADDAEGATVAAVVGALQEETTDRLSRTLAIQAEAVAAAALRLQHARDVLARCVATHGSTHVALRRHEASTVSESRAAAASAWSRVFLEVSLWRSAAAHRLRASGTEEVCEVMLSSESQLAALTDERDQLVATVNTLRADSPAARSMGMLRAFGLPTDLDESDVLKGLTLSDDVSATSKALSTILARGRGEVVDDDGEVPGIDHMSVVLREQLVDAEARLQREERLNAELRAEWKAQSEYVQSLLTEVEAKQAQLADVAAAVDSATADAESSAVDGEVRSMRQQLRRERAAVEAARGEAAQLQYALDAERKELERQRALVENALAGQRADTAAIAAAAAAELSERERRLASRESLAARREARLVERERAVEQQQQKANASPPPAFAQRPGALTRTGPPTVTSAASAANVRRLEAEVRQLAADKKKLEEDLHTAQRAAGNVAAAAAIRRTGGGADGDVKQREAALEERRRRLDAEQSRLEQEGRTLSDTAKQIVEAQRQLDAARARFAAEQRSSGGRPDHDAERCVGDLERRLRDVERERDVAKDESKDLSAQMQEGLANFKAWGESRTTELLQLKSRCADLERQLKSAQRHR